MPYTNECTSNSRTRQITTPPVPATLLSFAYYLSSAFGCVSMCAFVTHGCVYTNTSTQGIDPPPLFTRHPMIVWGVWTGHCLSCCCCGTNDDNTPSSCVSTSAYARIYRRSPRPSMADQLLLLLRRRRCGRRLDGRLSETGPDRTGL